MRLRLGVIGCGGAAQAIHLPILAAMAEDFEIAAVADEREQRAAQSARRFGAPVHFTSASALLRGAAVDALVILTPSHEQQIDVAIDHGIHVFTEKPISLDAAVSRRLVERAAKARVVLEVGLMRLYDPALQVAHEGVAAVPPSSAFFMKYDGSDAVRRRQLLARDVETYTFDSSSAARAPEGLSARQSAVLEQLLWSGAHLLSALAALFPRCRPARTSIAPDRSIHCEFAGAQGEILQLSLLAATVPVYHEEIRLVAPCRLTSLAFGSPYQHPGWSRVTVHGGAESPVSTRQEFHRSAFRAMWSAFHGELTGGAAGASVRHSASLACEIEQLALDAARLAS